MERVTVAAVGKPENKSFPQADLFKITAANGNADSYINGQPYIQETDSFASASFHQILNQQILRPDPQKETAATQTSSNGEKHNSDLINSNQQNKLTEMQSDSASTKNDNQGRSGEHTNSVYDTHMSKNKNKTVALEETKESDATKEQIIIFAGLISVPLKDANEELQVSDTLMPIKQKMEAQAGAGQIFDESAGKKDHDKPGNQTRKAGNEGDSNNKDGLLLAQYESGRENEITGKIITSMADGVIKPEHAKQKGQIDDSTPKTSLSKEAVKNNVNAFTSAIDNIGLDKMNPDTDAAQISLHDIKAAATVKESSPSKSVVLDSHLLAGETTNTVRTEVMQSLWIGANDKVKNDLRSKNSSSGKIEEDFSFDLVSGSPGTAVNAEKITDIKSTAIIERVANEIKENVSNDSSRIKIVLNPPSLGELSMDVIIRNNKVEVVLTATSKDVQQALNSNLDQLKNTLLNQGLTVERCDVLMQDKHDEFCRPFGNQAYYRDGSGREGKEGRRGHDEEQSSAVPVARNPGSIVKVSSGIDTISLFA
jgi:flagellar hook-length control protein FliK